MADQDTTFTPNTYAQLFSLAVHEFRTPVSVVGGYLRMLQHDTATPLGDRHRKMVTEAEKSCARLVALIGELNEIAKLEDPAVPLPQEVFDLFAVLKEVAGETHESEDRSVQLKMRGLASGAPLKGDLVRMHAALGSLLRAALREQPDNAVLVADCRLAQSDSRRTATIVIAKEDQVASAIAAAPTPFDDKRGGLGLSLPIARRVIQRHGGRVWSPPAEKAGYGSKSSIVISLPTL